MYRVENGMLLSKDGKTLIAFPAVGKINSGVVNLPEITTIAHFAFYNCTALTTVSLPETTTIGRAAFCNCTALTTVSLPKAATIGEIAFGVTGSQALTVTLGDTIPTLGIGMFDTYITGAKSVIVKVPDNTAWSGIIGGSFTGPENTGGTYWGEGFRGKGWESGAYGSGSAYGISSAVNENITLTIQAAP
jgi:hypothetical protein